MAVDDVIVRPGPVAVPLEYTVPTGTEIVPKVVTATLDGSGAAGAFLAVLEVIAPNGTVTARCLRQESIAAGASASVSWFPGGGIDDAVSAAGAGAGSGSAPSAGITTIASPTGTIAVSSPSGPTADVDLPASGAAAGTYGDSTHVGEFTVDAEGRITAAVSVAISGSGGAGGLISLFDSGYLGADAASIDTGAGGIAAGHLVLIILAYLRTSSVAANDNVSIILNNDTGANYDWCRVQASGGSVAVSTAAGLTFLPAGTIAGGAATANAYGTLEGWVPAYDGGSNWKGARFESTCIDANVGNYVATSASVNYRSTAAISRLLIKSQTVGANLKAGSRLIIYGAQ